MKKNLSGSLDEEDYAGRFLNETNSSVTTRSSSGS
jgi:hypothetical protein